MMPTSSDIQHIIIACPAPLLRNGLQSMLLPFFGEQAKVLHAQTLAEVRHLLQQYSPQLLIIAAPIAAQEGINWTEIKFTQPQLKVLLFVRDPNAEIQNRFHGQIDINITEEALDALLHRLFPREDSHDSTTEASNLSARETEILHLMVTGKTTKKIAEMLSLSHHTVSTHRKNIINKLGIKTLAGLTVYAIMKGIVDLEDMPKK